MIKFFRKIRQNLLSEGKTGKYLKYAFGEIVLVVIGILIALQINNWNEQRKERIQEKILIGRRDAGFGGARSRGVLNRNARHRAKPVFSGFRCLRRKNIYAPSRYGR